MAVAAPAPSRQSTSTPSWGEDGRDPVIFAEELKRENKISDIADWYREEPSLHELKGSGRDVSIAVDHMDRIIRIESHDRGTTRRTPIEERMEFDRDVLTIMKRSLANPNQVVILDTSDIPGKIWIDRTVTRGLSAKVVTMDIASGEPVDEKTISKEQPDFPEKLREELLAVPKGPEHSYVNLRTYVAERFVATYLRSDNRQDLPHHPAGTPNGRRWLP